MTDQAAQATDLSALRLEMDQVNREMLELFERRMEIAERVADCKRATGRSVNDPARERAILAEVRQNAKPGMDSYATVLFSLLMEMSRGYQERLLHPTSPLKDQIEGALANTPQLFPPAAMVACQGVEGAYSQLACDKMFKHPTISYFKSFEGVFLANTPQLFPPAAMVACQGVEGAYSQLACDKMFKHPTISYFKSFEGVFQAIEAGFCDYGVLPLENSSAGTVNAVYDLMMEHDFHIVRTCRFKVDHDVLALPGATLDGLTEIYSHEQAIGQCSAFLEKLKGVKVIPVTNTAEAARMVAESGRTDIAALSSRACADIYGLVALARQVNDTDNNYTRFACIGKGLQVFPGADRTSLMMVACIGKGLQVFPGADRTSLMMVLSHEPGSLYKVLARLYSLDINLTKLESRPIPGRDFEFMFYFDLETPVYSPEFAALICELDDICESFTYLGSYSELA